MFKDALNLLLANFLKAGRRDSVECGLNPIQPPRSGTVEVLQREFGIAVRSQGHSRIGTTGVTTCTIWLGWDTVGTLAFLCHFDYPWTTKVIPDVLDALSKHASKDTKFTSILLGGRSDCLRWSHATRNRIFNSVEAYKIHHPNLELTVDHGAFLPIFGRRGYSLDLGKVEPGTYSKRPLLRSKMDQKSNAKMLWRPWLPMQRASGSAVPPRVATDV
jgi:hypothetical protein